MWRRQKLCPPVICLLLLLSAHRSQAMDFTILVHPGTGIKAERVKAILIESFQQQTVSDEFFKDGISRAGVRDAADLKNLGEQQGVFLVFAAPTVVPVNNSI